MRYQSLLLAALAAMASDATASSPILLTVNDYGDAGPGNCAAACTLRDALHDIADGGIIEFAPTPVPQTITLAHGALVINRSVTILGPGPAQLAINASKLSQVLIIFAPQSALQVVVVGVTLRDGKVVGADGPDGIDGVSGMVNGQPGQQANGGCLFANLVGPYAEPSSIFLEQIDVRECEAIGGNGGTGGTGTAGSGLSTGGTGGAGGWGGSAAGGGIYVQMLPGSSLDLADVSVFNASATGGNAGPAGDGGPGFFRGTGGVGGSGASAGGGAIFVSAQITTVLYNSTVADSAATAGNGADGGDGDASLDTAHGGNGGNGGSAGGGLVAMPSGASVAFTTLSHGSLKTGAPGNGGAGKVGGAPGQPGTASGVAISSGQATAVATVIVGPLSASAALCSPGVVAKPGYVNLDEDSSCGGFTLHGSLAELFLPLDLSGTAWPAYMPRYGSKIIDAAQCSDGTIQPPTDDQHGTARPQGAQCDLGAIEADYLFVAGFD